MALASKAKIFHFETVESTNDVAFELLKEGEKSVVVVADWQTAGRGRNGKTWESSKQKNLLFSFGISHSIKDISLYLLQVIGSLATKKTLEKYIDKERIYLKYPNDVYVKTDDEYKKIAGIISETNYLNENNCHSVIGIGVNIMQVPDKVSVPNAVALAECTKLKNEINIEKITLELKNNIEEILINSEEIIFNTWTKELNIIGKKIIVLQEENKQYFALSILKDCRLLVEDTEKQQKIIDNGDSIRYEFQ